MDYYVYIMATHDNKCLHCGFTSDLIQSMGYYNSIDFNMKEDKPLLKLIYFEHQKGHTNAKKRLDDMTGMALSEKLTVAMSTNETLKDLIEY